MLPFAFHSLSGVADKDGVSIPNGNGVFNATESAEDASAVSTDGYVGNDGAFGGSSVGGSGDGSGGSGSGYGGSGTGRGSGSGGFLSDLNFNISSNEDASTAVMDAESHLQWRLNTISDGVLEKARQIAENALVKTPNSTLSHNADTALYEKLRHTVATEVNQLRVILASAEAREKERVWLKHQLNGEIDNDRIVDLITGDRNVFTRLGKHDNAFSAVQKLPKRVRFVMDCSSSMSRFNGSDRRLDRMAACACMIMEAFHQFEHKFDYSIVGHDGESAVIPFVEFGASPTSPADRWNVIEGMMWNATTCQSGDNTLAATEHAIMEVQKEAADEYFVFVLSDANLMAYGVSPSCLGDIVRSQPTVNSFVIFIAGETTGKHLIQGLPLGHGAVCTDTVKLPGLFKNFFRASLLKESSRL